MQDNSKEVITNENEKEMQMFRMPGGAQFNWHITNEGYELITKSEERKRLKGRGYPLGSWNCFNPIIANIHEFGITARSHRE